ncbi:glycosyltransferase involved in cell wall biosynthesis [Pedobacter sp. CG_S7]|uniref:glycosyltransferase family 4 protein n=1 Tax=Pedobacter sp. CG_S7 TaxID=3143930 RepID=UPI00339866BB
MNIGFDGKRAANNLTGLGNYSRSLLAQLLKLFDQNQYFVYTPKVTKNPKIIAFFESHQLQLKLPSPGSIKLFWRSFSIKKQLIQDKIDLFHGLSQEIPVGLRKEKIKSVVTIHDLIYLRHPEYYKTIDRYIYNKKSEYACKNSDRIIAISERTKKDIIDFYAIPEDKIEVIYQSCDDSFKKLTQLDAQKKVLKKYELPDKYLLNVGTIEPRKNLLLVIEGLQAINHDYKLVVVGKQQAYARIVKAEINRLNLNDRVIFLEKIPFEDLPVIYQMATIFIYPSLYEGFGIPIIEALYSKVPVIAATGSCLEEAGGPGSIYISPSNAKELALETNKVLADKELQKNMKEEGLKYVQQFDNQLLAKQLMNCYLKTLNGKFTSC